MAEKKKGMGKGLGALKIESVALESNISTDDNKILSVDINKITPNTDQPRKTFDEESLDELAESIKNMGIIQPITVKRSGEFYTIIAGERRWRAARKAGIGEVPVMIRDDISDLEALELALIENIQREDLNPLEEAQTYKRFADDFNLNQEAIAEKVGKSRAAVANSIRLLNLDKRVQTFLLENRLSNGHCRALLAITDNDKQFEAAEHIIEEGLSVRQTEEFVKLINEAKEEETKKASIKDPSVSRAYLVIQNDLRSILGTKVKVNRNKISIDFHSDEELDRIVGLLRQIQQ